MLQILRRASSCSHSRIMHGSVAAVARAALVSSLGHSVSTPLLCILRTMLCVLRQAT